MSQPDDRLDRDARVARNQSLFRDIHECGQTIEGGLHALVSAASTGWLCECANQSCFERITMPHEVYEAIREHGARFLVAPGDDHFVPDIERLIEQNENYWIVEQAGEVTDTSRPDTERVRDLLGSVGVATQAVPATYGIPRGLDFPSPLIRRLRALVRKGKSSTARPAEPPDSAA